MAVAQDVQQGKVGSGDFLICPDVLQGYGQRHLQGHINCILYAIISGGDYGAEHRLLSTALQSQAQHVPNFHALSNLPQISGCVGVLSA